MTDADAFRVDGEVERYPGPDGWFFVRVPHDHSAATRPLADRGLVPITVTLGGTTWETSLLPSGDGTHFVPLKAAVRRAERLELGDRVALRYEPRSR